LRLLREFIVRAVVIRMHFDKRRSCRRSVCGGSIALHFGRRVKQLAQSSTGQSVGEVCRPAGFSRTTSGARGGLGYFVQGFFRWLSGVSRGRWGFHTSSPISCDRIEYDVADYRRAVRQAAPSPASDQARAGGCSAETATGEAGVEIAADATPQSSLSADAIRSGAT
jgi:hypothetical protein